MILCKDCKYYSRGSGQCNHPKNLRTSLEDGKKYPIKILLEELRDGGRFWSFMENVCGEKARWFEPKL